MKKYFLPLIGCFLLTLAACKKDTQGSRPNAIVGKWYETRLILNIVPGTTPDHDTTYNAGSFTNDDYWEFSGAGKAVFSESGIYGLAGKSVAISGDKTGIGVMHYSWSIADSMLTLNRTDFNPATTQYASGTTHGPDIIVQLDAKHLVIRSQSFGPAPFNFTTVSYFTKGN